MAKDLKQNRCYVDNNGDGEVYINRNSGYFAENDNWIIASESNAYQQKKKRSR